VRLCCIFIDAILSEISSQGSIANDRASVAALGSKLGIDEKDIDAWYDVDAKRFEEIGGNDLVSKYGSLWALLSTVYPERKWLAFKLGKVPHGYWTSVDHQREFLENVAPQLKVNKGDIDGWYGVSGAALKRLGGGSILNLYDRSLSKLLMAVYPNHSWDLAKFSKRPQNYWASVENHRKFMDDLGKKLKLRDLDGWYSVSIIDLIPFGVWRILDLYGRSLTKLLTKVYPEHPWDLSRFPKKPQNYWSSLENQRKFVDALGKKIGIHSEADFDQWYDQSVRLLLDNGGGGLSKRYNKSLPALLAAIYPHYNWQLWRFPGKISQVLDNEEELVKFCSNMEASLGIREPEEWYRVTTAQLTNLKVPFFKANPGGLLTLLSKRYPNIKWDAELFLGRGYRRATLAIA